MSRDEKEKEMEISGQNPNPERIVVDGPPEDKLDTTTTLIMEMFKLDAATIETYKLDKTFLETMCKKMQKWRAPFEESRRYEKELVRQMKEAREKPGAVRLSDEELKARGFATFQVGVGVMPFKRKVDNNPCDYQKYEKERAEKMRRTMTTAEESIKEVEGQRLPDYYHRKNCLRNFAKLSIDK